MSELELNKVYLRDCLDIMKDIPDNYIDLMIIDPPYFIPAKHYSTKINFRRNFGDLGILESFFKIFFKETERIMKPTGAFYIFCNDQSYPLFFYHTYLFIRNVRSLIWDKIYAMLGWTWRHQYEMILFGQMPQSKGIPTGDGDLIKCKGIPVKKRDHPAQKPLELIEKLLLKSSKEGDLVADFFAGTGVVIEACKKHNRNYIATEVEYNYYKKIK